MMVVAKKMKVFNHNLNFLAHSIKVAIVFIILKLFILDFAQIRQVFLAFILHSYLMTLIALGLP